MQIGDLKFFNGTIYYLNEQNQLVPLRIGGVGGGGGGLSRSSVISLINQFGGVGVNIESGAFTLAADGMSATINGVDAGANLINPGANPTLTITTIKQLELGHFQWGNSPFGTGAGTGKGNLSAQSSVYKDENQNMIFDSSNCIYLFGAGSGDGWSGLITAISTTSYSITFTQISSGDNLNCQWHAITGN